MANVAKYNRSQIGGLTRHFERYQKEDGTYQQFGNQDIDLSRSEMNYNLAPERDGGQLRFIGERTSEVKCQNRADVNVMCSWVVTAPAGLATDVTYGADDKPRLSFEGNEDELRRFFEESYRFLNERYAGGSDKNVISAYVHMDETTPHLHYAFVPVVYDGNKDIDKVSAKVAVCRSDLQTFHQDLERHMEKVFGREIGILNNATRSGNKDVQTLKRENTIAEAEKVLADELRRIEGKLAVEKTINKLAGKNVKEQRKYGAVGEKGVFIVGATKRDVLAIAKGARERVKANEKASIAVKEKATAYKDRDYAVQQKNKAERELERSSVDMSRREQEVAVKEESLNEREKDVTVREQNTDTGHLMKMLQEKDGQLEKNKEKIKAIESENAILKEHSERAKALEGEVSELKRTVEYAHESSLGLIGAVRELQSKGQLNREQRNIVTAMIQYGAKNAREDGMEALARKMLDKNIFGLSASMEAILKTIKRSQQSHER